MSTSIKSDLLNRLDVLAPRRPTPGAVKKAMANAYLCGALIVVEELSEHAKEDSKAKLTIIQELRALNQEVASW